MPQISVMHGQSRSTSLNTTTSGGSANHIPPSLSAVAYISMFRAVDSGVQMGARISRFRIEARGC